MKRAECWIRSNGETSALILSPSLLHSGGWRITSWDQLGPQGHTEHGSLAEARKELQRDTGPWPAVPEFEIKARPAVYRLAETEPAWLGLAVITNGVLQNAA